MGSHTTPLIWGLLMGLFVLVVYVVDKIKKRKNENPSATWMQKHVVVVIIASILIPVGIGIILVNTVQENRRVVKKRVIKKVRNSAALAQPTVPAPPKPEPIIKVVISDGSRHTDVATLNQCRSNEVTLIRNGTVRCAVHPSPTIRAWMADVRLHEDRAIKSFIRYYVNKQATFSNKKVNATPKNKPKAMQQGFWWLQQSKTKVTQATTVEKLPFKDRYAAIFYFLFLVLGVLGTYYWDYADQKSRGVEVKFQPHLIVVSFIIAAMVYYSIQQGIEKEANKLTFRGVMFAFNNGLMWQTILTKFSQRGRNGQTPKPSVESGN